METGQHRRAVPSVSTTNVTAGITHGARHGPGPCQSRGFLPLPLPASGAVPLREVGLGFAPRSPDSRSVVYPATAPTLSIRCMVYRAAAPALSVRSACGSGGDSAPASLPLCTYADPNHPPSLTREQGPARAPVQCHLLAEARPFGLLGCCGYSGVRRVSRPCRLLSPVVVMNVPRDAVQVVGRRVRQDRLGGRCRNPVPRCPSQSVFVGCSRTSSKNT